MLAVSFENLFFTILHGHILYMECLIGHPCGRTYRAQLSSKSRHTEDVFHLNNTLDAPLNLKRNLITFIRIFIINTPVLALKFNKRGVGVNFGMQCYGYALNCLFVYLVIPGTRPSFKRRLKLFI